MVSQGLAQLDAKYGTISSRVNHMGNFGRNIWPAVMATTGVPRMAGSIVSIFITFISSRVYLIESWFPLS
jgi:hypothetical protein